MKFLEKVVDDLLVSTKDLSNYIVVIPGKRPLVFIKKILSEKGYTGFLPDFYTVEEIITEISGKLPLQGTALWLFSYEVYQKIFDDEDFGSFVKWFPTLQKDWDDILKFSENEKEVLDYMFAEEHIKNWGEILDDSPRKRFLDFWKKNNIFLPKLKQELQQHQYATSGMIHEEARKNMENFCIQTDKKFVLIGFNAFTPVEELLVRTLLQWDKAICYFQADHYYIDDERQEAGTFLRDHLKWKEFNEYRPFKWIENDFEKPKKIQVFEVSGNISQTKILPGIFKELKSPDLEDTALVLLDENLLPASLEALGDAGKINITMGFPLKNLEFSTAVKHLFHVQKQLQKSSKSYYYNDILAVLDAVPVLEEDRKIIDDFRKEITDKNMVYLSLQKLQEMLGPLSYFHLLLKKENTEEFLDEMIDFCFQLKFQKKNDDILFENISHFEKTFKVIRNLSSQYHFTIHTDTLEILINQIINTETIDFQGEPLEGLQVMGLLETRLLNFKNIIMLSVNEGKLPLGNTQSSYLPFDVRKRFGMHTFLENDSIYAYHFYRLLQDSENIFLLYNGQSSGINTGEKSRFITQIELESPHQIEEIVIENNSEPVEDTPMTIEKTPAVIQCLEEWKKRVSASHLTSYLYNPIQFYLNYILKTKETAEIEEELSQRNYGNLVHYSLEYLYSLKKCKILNLNDIDEIISKIDEGISHAVSKMNHQPEYYEKGMNYIHKNIARKVIEKIIGYDRNLVLEGHSLEIIDLERKIENIEYVLDPETKDTVVFMGFIDRIDRLDGTVRVIDYKTAKAKKLSLNFKDENALQTLFLKDDYKQAIQLCIYMYYLRNYSEFSGGPADAGIWSFAEVSKGVQMLSFVNGDENTAMQSIGYLIGQILNPEIPFIESVKKTYSA